MTRLCIASFLLSVPFGALGPRAQTEVGTWLSPNDPFAPVPKAPLAADGTLAASLCDSNGTRVAVYDLATGALTLVVPDASDEPAGLATNPPFDGPSVDVAAGRVIVGAPNDDTTGGDAGRVWIFDATTGVELLDLVAPDAAAGDRFGADVAFADGDLLVGAPGSDDLLADAGSAYLLDATTGALLFELHSQNPDVDARFGDAVALGNGFAVVGEPKFGLGNRGTVYVFDVQTGAQLHKLIPGNAVAGLHFGGSLAIHGDRLVTGAPGTGGVSVPSRAYLFDLPSGAELFELVPSGSDVRNFGRSVAIDATRVIVGDPNEIITGNNDNGATYVFDATDGTELARLTGIPLEDLGESVALASGIGLASSKAVTPPSSNGGTIRTIDATTGGPTGTLEPQNGPFEDQLGTRLALDGDRALVAAPGDDADGKDSGSVYVWDVATGTALFALPHPTPGEQFDFGAAVDLDGDRAVVGLPDAEEPVVGIVSGAVAVYDVTSGALLDVWYKPGSPGPSNVRFGGAVAIDDGRVLVGARNAPDAGPAAGAVFVFDVASGALLRTLLPPVGVGIRDFGESVALHGSCAVVGGSYEKLSGSPADVAPIFVFDVVSGAQIAQFVPSDLHGVDPTSFGNAVATDGTRVLVGGPAVFTPGAIWLFDLATGAELWSVAPAPSTDLSGFGTSVAIDGSLAVAGAAPFTTNPYPDSSLLGYDVATGQERFLIPAEDDYDYLGTAVALEGTTLLIGAPYTEEPALSAGSVRVFDVPAIPSALPYCVAKTSTAGCVASIGWSGPAAAPTSGQGDWSITASGVQGQRTGLLIGGLSGTAAFPFNGGTLCVFPPQKRGLTMTSGGTPGACDGAYQVVVNDASFPQGFDAGPGQTAWYQWWYRDPPSPTGPVALSDALEVPFE